MKKWGLIQNKPLATFQTFKEPPIISNKKEKSWPITCLLEPKNDLNDQSNDASVLHVLKRSKH